MVNMAPSLKLGNRVRVSKNKKKSWRKYSNVKDVEEFLEEQRHEERTGGCVADKPDDQLFFTDTKKTLAKEKCVQGKDIVNKLRCHSAVCYSSIKPPINPRQTIGKKLKARCSIAEAKKLKNIVQNLQSSKSCKNVINPPGSFLHDLWDEDKDEKIDPEIKELVDYRDEITRKKPAKVPNHLYQKPSLLPAVEFPHPGASYNPSFVDHQNLLQEAVIVEMKKEKEENHLKRILTDMFPSKSEAPTEGTWITEMSQGLFEDAEEDNDMEPRTSCLSLNPPVTTENQKSKSKKKKEKLRREEAQKKILEKQTKHEMNKVFKLRGLLSEIKQKELISEKRQQKKEQESIEKLYKPRTISRYKYEPNDIEVNLSEELSGSLRGLKVEGNILEDRYKSLQRRNIIEPRIRQKRKRKYKLKVQVKRSHRDFE